MSIKDSKAIDLMISSDGFMTNLYHKSFWYDGPVYECGYSRDDIFFVIIKKRYNQEKIKKKVCEFFQIGKENNLILYAPTFRENHNFNVYDIDYEKLISACEKRFRNKFVVLVHLHPNVAYKFNQLKYNKYIINATIYPDMQELMVASYYISRGLLIC